ncbi:hypothetical protein O181_078595 [Austropuccinia psidii MF-1]|uniref:Uncharacterized protein n=1 Tax=Austropuccinia psidii MF-1 TaxID=1389203 RepID=A0A9Q3FJZ0_9BASI|nr:hypothetical protein [Austropuccinia psidii MF-1]
MRVKLWSMSIFMVPRTPWIPRLQVKLGLGGSSNPHRPWAVGQAKAPKDQKTPKRPKRHPITIWSKTAIGMAKAQSFRPILTDIGEKPPPWRMPKVNEVEEDPRGPTSQSIVGIYVHITIIHPFL